MAGAGEVPSEFTSGFCNSFRTRRGFRRAKFVVGQRRGTLGVDDNPEGTVPTRTGQNESTMFPGWSLTSEQLQDIKNNERPQTLVVSGFTGRNHMFVQPIRGGGSNRWG